MSEPVTSYVKPLFITITTVAVVFTRYAAVFPLSEGINLFQKHARGQRSEELPHSYQMMLFWAGLRGAVGVALAAGFKGPNAQILRTTVLVVVVLTVLFFGGTTARMLEVLGIRTGVEDDGASSSDDEDPSPPLSRNAWGGARGGRWSRFVDDQSSALPLPPSQYARGAARIGTHYTPRQYNHQFIHSQQRPQSIPGPRSPTTAADQAVFSAASSDSYDSDGEVLPLAPTVQDPTGHPPTQSSEGGAIGEDGKWFQTLDERYLLPLFSNATASRTFHARRARRSASATGGAANGGSANGSNFGTPADSEDEVDLGQEVEYGLGVGGGRPAFNRSVSAVVANDESRIARGLPSPVLRTSPSLSDNRLS